MSRVSRGFKLAGFLIKFLFTLLVAFVCGFLIWRMVSSSTPKELTRLTVNEDIKTAYGEADGALELFTQKQNTTTRADYNAGYFSIVNTVFVPQANQIQVVFRYNNSTIRSLVNDYELSDTPEREEDLFDVSLFLAIDLTPENKDDNAEISEEGTRTVRCFGKQVISEEKNLYNYRKFIFDLDECGEDIEALLNKDILLAVYADIYYVEDINYDESAYGTLCIYDYITEKKDIKLANAERKEIEAYQP